MESSDERYLRVVVRQLGEPNCADCGHAVLRVRNIFERLSKPVFEISKEDVVGIAKKIGIHEDSIDWRAVEKYVENYNFEGTFNVWNAIEDALKEGQKCDLKARQNSIAELARALSDMKDACKIHDQDIQRIINGARDLKAANVREAMITVRQIIAEYSRNPPAAYEDDGGQTGAAIGAIAASAAATGLGGPELIPIAAPAGSAAGSAAEKELRKRIKF
jgi:hypothetical protein